MDTPEVSAWNAQRVNSLVQRVRELNTNKSANLEREKMNQDNLQLHKQLAEMRLRHSTAMSDLSGKGKKMEELMRQLIDDRQQLSEKVSALTEEAQEMKNRASAAEAKYEEEQQRWKDAEALMMMDSRMPEPQAPAPKPQPPATVDRAVQASIGTPPPLPRSPSPSKHDHDTSRQQHEDAQHVGTQTENDETSLENGKQLSTNSGSSSSRGSGSGSARKDRELGHHDRSHIEKGEEEVGQVNEAQHPDNPTSDTSLHLPSLYRARVPPALVRFKSIADYPVALSVYALGRWCGELNIHALNGGDSKNGKEDDDSALCAWNADGFWSWRRVTSESVRATLARIRAYGDVGGEEEISASPSSDGLVSLWWCSALAAAAAGQEYHTQRRNARRSLSGEAAVTVQRNTACDLICRASSTFAGDRQPLNAMTLHHVIDAISKDRVGVFVYEERNGETGENSTPGAQNCNEALILSVSVVSDDALFYLVRFDRVEEEEDAEEDAFRDGMAYALLGEWITSAQLIQLFSSYRPLQHGSFPNAREIRVPMTITNHVGSVALRFPSYINDLGPCIQAWAIDRSSLTCSPINLMPRGDAFIVFSPTQEHCSDTVVVLLVNSDECSIRSLQLCEVPSLTEHGVYASHRPLAAHFQLDGEEIFSSSVHISGEETRAQQAVEPPVEDTSRSVASDSGRVEKNIVEESRGAKDEGAAVDAEKRLEILLFERRCSEHLQILSRGVSMHTDAVVTTFAVATLGVARAVVHNVVTSARDFEEVKQVEAARQSAERASVRKQERAMWSEFTDRSVSFMSDRLNACSNYAERMSDMCLANLSTEVHRVARAQWLMVEQAESLAASEAAARLANARPEKDLADACVGTVTHAAWTAMRSSSAARHAAQLAMVKSQRQLLYQRYATLQEECMQLAANAQERKSSGTALVVASGKVDAAESVSLALRMELEEKESLLEEARRYREKMEVALNKANSNVTRLETEIRAMEQVHREELEEKKLLMTAMAEEMRDLRVKLNAVIAEQRGQHRSGSREDDVDDRDSP